MTIVNICSSTVVLILLLFGRLVRVTNGPIGFVLGFFIRNMWPIFNVLCYLLNNDILHLCFIESNIPGSIPQPLKLLPGAPQHPVSHNLVVIQIYTNYVHNSVNSKESVFLLGDY